MANRYIGGMRKLTFLLCPLLLTACGEGSAFDESFKTSYREKFVASCTTGAQSTIPEGVEVDLNKICACAADKIMEGKSAKDLATTMPGSAEDMAKVQLCAKEVGPVKINTAG